MKNMLLLHLPLRLVTEYDPETAVGTIRVAKKDSDDPTETEEVTGMTVPAGTTEIKKDADGNITDLAVSTAIDEVKNGFSLTSENKKLHSISISDKKNPKDHWITLSAKESATELGIRLRNGNNKIIITLTENEKPLNIIKVSDTEKDVILTTSTDGTCVINKAVQNISVDKDGKYSLPNKYKNSKGETVSVEPNGTRFSSLTSILDDNGNRIKFNDPKKSSTECLKLADEQFFNKSREQ